MSAGSFKHFGANEILGGREQNLKNNGLFMEGLSPPQNYSIIWDTHYVYNMTSTSQIYTERLTLYKWIARGSDFWFSNELITACIGSTF